MISITINKFDIQDTGRTAKFAIQELKVNGVVVGVSPEDPLGVRAIKNIMAEYAGEQFKIEVTGIQVTDLLPSKYDGYARGIGLSWYRAISALYGKKDNVDVCTNITIKQPKYVSIMQSYIVVQLGVKIASGKSYSL